MPGFEVALLGEPELVVDGKPWVLRAPRITWSLIALLVMHPRTQERASLACLIWPDREESVARATLRRYLHRLGNALPPGDWLIGDAKTVGWNHAQPCRVDVLEFERALADERLDDAVALYRGDLLGVAFEEAILDARERLRAGYLDALDELAARARADRRYGDAIRYSEQLLAVDEWREDALRGLMRARFHDGDRSGALAAYDRFARGLQAELHATPMSETTAMRDAILSGAAVAEDLPAPSRGGVPFVGRDGEMRALQHAWTRAARGSGATAFLSGEAGIGKSRLASELSAVVEAQGGRALLGRTSAPEAAAYEAILEALRAGFSLLERGDLEDVWWAVLAPFVPEIAAMYPDLVPAPELEADAGRLRLREAFARALATMAARKPLALVLEDLQWAGRETMELLESLSRRAAALPMLIVVTMRAEEVNAGHPLESVRRRLQRDRRGQSVALGRLTGEDVAKIAATLLDAKTTEDGAVERIAAVANGHPLFALQLLRNYRESGELPDGEASGASVGDAVVRRLERLPDDARQLADIAATIEGTFTVEELARVAGWEEARVFDAVGALLDGKLVAERGGERFAYGFAHALIENAVRASASGDRRARRRRIAAVLEDTRAGDDAASASIAAHWEAAGEAPRAASAYLRAANASVKRFARADAISQARRVVALTADERERFDALAIVVRETMDLGDYNGATRELEALEDLQASMDADARYRAFNIRLYAARFETVRHAAIAAEFETFVADAGREDWVAEAAFMRAWTTGREDFAAAEGALRSVVERATRGGNLDLAFRARSPLLQILLRCGKGAEALSELAALEREFERTGDRRALVPLSQGYLEYAYSTDFFEDASREKAAEYVNRLAADGGDVDLHLSARDVLAYGARVAWDVDRARSEHRACSRAADELGLVYNRAISRGNLGELELDLGHVERALGLLAEATAIAKRENYEAFLHAASVGVAEGNLALGRVDAARREARRAAKHVGRLGERRYDAAVYGVLGAADVAAGDVDGGIEHMRAGLELARALDSKRQLAHDLAGYLHALLDAQKFPGAEEAARELLPLFAANPQRHRSPGRIAFALVRAAQQRGDKAEAFRIRHLGKQALEAILARMSDAADRDAFSSLPANRELLEQAP